MEEDNKIYRRLFESANAAILILNLNFKFIDCNEMTLKLLGCRKEDILGKTPVDKTLSPEQQPNGQFSSDLGPEKFKLAIEGHDLQFIWMHLRKDGTELPVEVSLFGFNASHKQNFFVFWRDLSELKQKEKNLIESEERFRTIFTKATDGIILHSSNLASGITHCNEAAYKMLGYLSEKDLIGKTVLEISPEKQPDGTLTKNLANQFLNECLKNGQTRFEWIHLKKNGDSIWFDIVLTRITLNNEVYIHSQWRDITIMRKYREELILHRNNLENLVKERTQDLEKALLSLKNTQAQLIQSEKMASLGTLNAGMAHEINNPLNFIKGGITGLEKHLMQHEVEHSENVERMMEIIKSGVDRISNIVKNLGKFSKESTGFTQIENIHSILDNSLFMLQHELKQKVKIKKVYEKNTPPILGDESKLHQVMVNLITNAIHAMNGEGELILESSCCNKEFSISLSDNGEGIKEEYLNRVTDPFFTTKPPGKGTGIGLYITSKIMEEHNGRVSIQSLEGNGTKITLFFPLQ